MQKDKWFLTIVAGLILVLSLGIIIRGEKDKSIAENRSLTVFPRLTLESFLNSEFQSEVEMALTDQIILGETFKSNYNLLKNKNTSIVVAGLDMLGRKDQDLYDESNKAFAENRDVEDMGDSQAIEDIGPGYSSFQIGLTPFGNNLAKMDDTDHLVYPKRTVDVADDLFQSKADNYNKIVGDYPELSYSSYYIETDVDVDFINGDISHDLVESLHSKLDESIKKGVLYINTPEDYQKYFYKTDHHWDIEGQLQGYKDIIRTVKGKDEELLNIETILIEDAKYNGYKSRQSGDYNIYDDFSVLWSDLPKHEVRINGKKGSYGDKQSYLNGEFTQEEGINHYGLANGGDYGLIEYKFNQPKKENLLIFVESFSNPINSFIASHFNNTYLVDLRYYEEAYEKEFKFGEFVEKYKIDEVLFTGYYFFYANDDFLIKD